MNRFIKRSFMLTLLCFAACAHMPGQTVWSDDSWALFQEGTGPFNYSDHYIDHRTGIALTLFELNPTVSNFVPNFRGVPADNLPFEADRHGPWQIEYFCEPDYMLGYYTANQKTAAYFNTLSWERSLYYDQKKDRILLSYRHRAPEGWFLGHGIYDQVKNRKSPPVDIMIHFMWSAGSHVVIVQVDATNRGEERADISMVFQDAAYMWFPDGDQRNVAGGLWDGGKILPEIRLEKITTQTGKLAPVVAASWSKEHGVVSGFRHIRSSDPLDQPATIEAAGIGQRYVLVPPYVPVGHQLPLGKDQGQDLIRVIDRVHNAPIRPERPFLNRYLAYQFKDIRPGEKVTVRYDMVMGMGNSENMAESITKLIHAKPKR